MSTKEIISNMRRLIGQVSHEWKQEGIMDRWELGYLAGLQRALDLMVELDRGEPRFDKR